MSGIVSSDGIRKETVPIEKLFAEFKMISLPDL